MREHVEDGGSEGRHGAGWRYRTSWAATSGCQLVLGDCHEGMSWAEEGTFLSVAACFRFTSEDEVVMRANNTPFGSGGLLYTQNLARVPCLTGH
ncbi:aldehyde dehydrogenase family protein [Shigella flexneri]